MSSDKIRLMFNKEKYNMSILGVALLLVAFLLVVNYKVITQKTPLIWDAATHYMDSVRYYLAVKNMNWKSMPYIDRYWPPLGPLMPMPAYALLGPSPRIGIITENTMSMVMIIIGLYKLSEYFGKKTSMIATFVTITSPIILDQSTTFMIDLPLTAMVVLEWYLLLKSNGFMNRRYTVLSALFFGFGILAKWTFVFFVIVPILYELAIAFHIERYGTEIRMRPNINILKNALVFTGIVMLVAGWWYLPNIKLLAKSIIQNSRISGAIEGDPPVLSIKSALYYMFTSINFYLNPLLLSLFLVSSGILLAKLKKISPYIKLVIGQLVFTYVVFTMVRNKDPRFMMPIIPFLGITIGQALDYLEKAYKNKLVYTVFIIVLTMGGIMNVSTFTKVTPLIRIDNDSQIVAISGGNLYLSGYYWSFNLNTTEENWKIPEIISILRRDNSSHILVYILSNNPILTYPIRYRTITWKKTVLVIRPNTYRVIPEIFSADYVLYTKSEKHSARWEVKYSSIARRLFIKYNNITNAFVPVKRFTFPDGTEGILYKRRPSVSVIRNVTTDSIKVTCQRSNSTFGGDVRLKAICVYQIDKTYFIGYIWTPLRKMEDNYTIFVHITDKKGNTVYQMDHEPCSGLCPTSTWVPDKDIIEIYYLRFPLTGCYQIRLGLWNPRKRTRLHVSGNNDGHDRAIVGRICQLRSIMISPLKPR